MTSEDRMTRYVDDEQLLKKADDLASQLLSETSASKAALIRGKLEGLLHLAHIRSLATQYENGRESVELRKRELSAMESVAANVPKVSKPVADRLRELAQSLKLTAHQQRESAAGYAEGSSTALMFQREATAYTDAADQLEAILNEASL